MIEEVQTIAPWIQTLDGHAFDFEDMDSNVFAATEIATVLARTPRFAGHTRWTYSVAQHSVLVAGKFYSPERKLAALLHDAHEAITGDVSAPLKAWLKNYGGTDAFKKLERRIWLWIATKHGIDPDLLCEVRQVDMAALATEARDLMRDPPKPWCEMPAPWRERIVPWERDFARDEWLREYDELTTCLANESTAK